MKLDFNGVEENAFETENRIFKSRPILSRGLTAAKRDVSAGLNSALAIFAPNRRYPRQKELSHFQTRAKIPSHATAPCQA